MRCYGGGRSKTLAEITFCPIKPLRFASYHHLPSPIKPRKSPPLDSFSGNRPPKTIFLSPQNVLATLQNCPSDLTSLSFFFWCARQPHYFHDKPTFHHMVSVVSNLTRLHGSVKGIVEELGAVGCVTKAQTLLLLMRMFWCGSMYDMVLETFQEMGNYGYDPNTYARNIVMDVMFKIKRVDAALTFLKETRSPNFLSFNIAICNLCRLNDVVNVKCVLRSMLMSGYYMNPNTYSLVLKCFCNFSRLHEALQLLGMMMVLGVRVSVNVWSILIDGFCSSGQIEIAAYLLKKMIKIGCSPNIVTCTSLIRGYLKSQMPGEAFEILSALESKGCFPDLVLCNVLIDCLSKMGLYEDAFDVFSSLRERKLIPDIYTFSSLVSTICLSKQYVLLPLLTSGLAVEPDLVVCNGLLSYFCKSSYPEGAVEFYNDMIDRGFLPDKYSFAGVLYALCRLGRTQEAVNVYHGIIRTYPDIDAHILTIMINGLIKSGSSHEAMRLFRKAVLEKIPLDVLLYNVVIGGLTRDGQTKEAYALFTQMKEMNVAPDKRTYNLIISGFCKERDVNMFSHVLQEMVDKNIEIDHKTYKLVQKRMSLGLLPNVEQLLFFNGDDSSSFAGFSSLADRQDDNGSSTSDGLSESFVSVG